MISHMCNLKLRRYFDISKVRPSPTFEKSQNWYINDIPGVWAIWVYFFCVLSKVNSMSLNLNDYEEKSEKMHIYF